MIRTLVVLLLAVVISVAILIFWRSPDRLAIEPVLPALNELAANLTADEFKPVEQNYRYRFPVDHGPHTRQRSDLWQFSGTLVGAEGRNFAFQLSFLRFALTARTPVKQSNWTSKQLYRAHFALTDQEPKAFYAFERMSRAALGLAGSDKHKVWLENWFFEFSADGSVFSLAAQQDGIRLVVQLEKRKTAVTGIDNPLGAEASAFHAYLVPRFDAAGEIVIAGQSHRVRGKARLEHAWGLLPLSASGQITIDRFFIQLDDGRELFVLRLRRRDGSGAPVSSAWLIKRDGAMQRIQSRTLSLQAKEYWQSKDGLRYPVAWDLVWQNKNRPLTLTLEAMLAKQELPFAPRYWSGAVIVSGSAPGGLLQGVGYVELSAYPVTQDS